MAHALQADPKGITGPFGQARPIVANAQFHRLPAASDRDRRQRGMGVTVDVHQRLLRHAQQGKGTSVTQCGDIAA